MYGRHTETIAEEYRDNVKILQDNLEIIKFDVLVSVVVIKMQYFSIKTIINIAF